MKQKLLFVLLILSSCTNNNNYIISEHERLERKSGILPPPVFYGYYNFVIDSNNSVYYYSFQKPTETGHFYCEGPLKPHFSEIMPNHIFAIPKGTEVDFFKENVLKDKSSFRKFVVVGSETDTIRNEFLNQMLDLEKDTAIHL